MQKNITLVVSVILFVMLLFAGCSGQPETTESETQTTQEAAEESTSETAAPQWSITVKGLSTAELDSTFYQELKDEKNHGKDLTLEKKGEKRSYVGIPFRLVVGMADEKDEEAPYAFSEQKWQEGYDITLTAGDGYSVTFNTADIGPDTLYLATVENGEQIPPQIVGDVPGNLWVKNLETIELGLAAGEQKAERPGKDFTLVLDIGGDIHEFSLEELEATQYYTEGKGSYTTSAGTTYTNTYAGVKLAAFLQSFFDLQPETTVTFVAMDGYEMSYSGKDILDTSNGHWILAFKKNGNYMIKDPGYIRTVKIGPETPNIPGHLSVKMIEKIVVAEQGYEEFTLEMKGKMDFSLDRQTVQSCVNCHKRKVTFHHRKSGEDHHYTGFPVWRVLAYSDDPEHAPHKQGKSILSYKQEAVDEGYTVNITAGDGFSISLDATDLHRNEDVILAMYKNGEQLPERERPLIIVWDKYTNNVPEGIKSVRSIEEIELSF